jgi:hypothetical protein
MQAVLVAEDGIPLSKSIAKILDSDRRIQRVDFNPLGKTFNIRQLFAHCFIYVARSPSPFIIDKLRETGCPLILIAEEYYEECCESELFIPIDDFFAPKYLGSFCENILGLRSLYDMEHQRDLSSSIFGDEDNKEWERLIAERSEDSIPPNVHEPTPEQELAARPYFEESEKELCDGRDNTKETTGATAKNPILSDNEQKALDSWNIRECPKIASSKLNVSQATYYRIAARARKLVGQLESSSLYPQDSQSFGEKELT